MNRAIEALNHACRLNNEAVEILVTVDQTSLAIEILQSSLNVAKQLLSHVNTDITSHLYDNNNNSVIVGASIFKECPRSLTENPHDSGFVYNHPLLLNVPADLLAYNNNHNSGSNSTDNITTTTTNAYTKQHVEQVLAGLLPVYSALILLNIALVYHKIGRCRQDGKSYKRASLMYQMSLQLLENVRLVPPAITTTLITLILNNHAHVLFEQGNYGMSRQLLNAVDRAIQLCSNSTNNNTDDNNGNQDECENNYCSLLLSREAMQGLSLNIALLQAPKLASAA